MSGTNIASQLALDEVLRTSARRIVAQRPPAGLFEFDAVCDTPVSIGQAALIIAVVREAILNSIDYSHPAGVPGKILLSSSRKPDGSIGIEVADDGVGLPEGFDPEQGGGGGFRTMRRASAELGAVLSFRSSPLGLAVSLVLPATLEGQGRPS